MNRFYLMPKNTYFVFRRTHKVFHFFLCSFLFVFISFCFHFFSFSFVFVFISFSFHFFLLSFLQMFLHCLCCYHECYGFHERFTIRHFLPYTSSCFLTFGTICFYQGFPEADSSSLKIAGPSIQVQNTDLVHLLV